MEDFKKYFDCFFEGLIQHKDWLFSGLGISIFSLVSTFIYKIFIRRPSEDKSTPKEKNTAFNSNVIGNGNTSAQTKQGDRSLSVIGDVNINIHTPSIEELLNRKKKEIQDVPDASEFRRLEKELAALFDKLANPQQSDEDIKNIYIETINKLNSNKYRHDFTTEQLECAKSAFERGDTGEAEKLFNDVYKRGIKNTAEAAYMQGVLAKSRVDFRNAYQWFKKAAELDQDNLDYLDQAGKMAWTLGYYQEAEQFYDRALTVRKRTLGSDHQEVGLALNKIVRLYDELGKYDKARPLARKAKTILETKLGLYHPDVAKSIYNLAMLYERDCQYEEAEKHYQRAYDIFKQAYGKNHKDVALCLNNLGKLYYLQGKYKDAENTHREALNIRKKVLEKTHTDIAQSLSNLGQAYLAQKDYKMAESLYKDAIKIYENRFGAHHPNLAYSYSDLGLVYAEQGGFKEALSWYDRAKAIWDDVYGSEHINIATYYNNIAQLYSDQGEDFYGEAEKYFIKAKEILEKIYSLNLRHPDIAQCFHNLALLYQNQERYDEAELYYQKTLVIRKETLPPTHADIACTLADLAYVYGNKQGKIDVAKPLYEEALDILDKANGFHSNFREDVERFYQDMLKASGHEDEE